MDLMGIIEENVGAAIVIMIIAAVLLWFIIGFIVNKVRGRRVMPKNKAEEQSEAKLRRVIKKPEINIKSSTAKEITLYILIILAFIIINIRITGIKSDIELELDIILRNISEINSDVNSIEYNVSEIEGYVSSIDTDIKEINGRLFNANLDLEDIKEELGIGPVPSYMYNSPSSSPSIDLSE